jgi:hypothetical protein
VLCTHVHLLAGTEGNCPLDLDFRVVDELECIRIAHLDIDVAALFSNDVERGYAAELVGLSPFYDRSVLPRGGHLSSVQVASSHVPSDLRELTRLDHVDQDVPFVLL